MPETSVPQALGVPVIVETADLALALDIFEVFLVYVTDAGPTVIYIIGRTAALIELLI